MSLNWKPNIFIKEKIKFRAVLMNDKETDNMRRHEMFSKILTVFEI